MIISTKAWLEYIRKMSAISEQAANEMQKWIQKNGFDDDQALLEYAFALSTKYGEAIGALACDMYEKIAEAQGVTIPPAEMADTPEFGEVAKAVHGTMIESLNKVDATVGRLVKQTGADTILKNAKRDGAYFAWVAHGDTCPYCLMLSAIGWQKAGKNTIRGKHADHIHPHCDCQYVVDFKGDLKVEGYDPEKMQQEIMDIVDPDEKEYAGFEDFIGRYGRQTWSRKGRDNTGLNMIRRRFDAKQEKSESKNENSDQNVTTTNKNTKVVEAKQENDIIKPDIKSLPFEDIPNESLSERDARAWYIEHDKKIPEMIDRSKSIEEQARQACDLRNKHRTQARDLMENQEIRKELDRTDPNKSFEELIEDKMNRKGLSYEEAIEDILKTATKTRKSVDERYGLE